MNQSMKKVVCGALASVMLLGTATMAKAATPFTDVSGDSWYASYVDYAYNNKLMAGTSDTTFAPNQIMTRGMLVTVLHSIAGKPSHSGNNPFSDVGDSWYTNAVLWCYEHGVVAGTSATTFSPNSPVTREQMVAIMFKFAAANKLDTSSRADLSGYVDAKNITVYAQDAFSWAVAKGVISGTSDTDLSPKGQATRAQCATILQRYHELLNAKPEPQPTEPPVTEPENPDPSVHKHDWVHTHHDAVGHYERKVVCTICEWYGKEWYCTESMANAVGQDILSYWMDNHQDPMAQKDQQHSYKGGQDFHVDVPAYDEWKCASCGEIRREEETHVHDWEHRIEYAIPVKDTVIKCKKCNYFYRESKNAQFGELTEIFKEYHSLLWDHKGDKGHYEYEIYEDTFFDPGERDMWFCKSCGEVVHTDPNA